MKQYLDLLQDILDNGVKKGDRTGTGTLSVFGRQLRFDLQDGFPLLTTKKIHFKSVAYELLWMLSGSTNNKDLEQHGVTIWREWAREDGELGPIYGKSWRDFGGSARLIGKDQISDLVSLIRTNPDSRRMVVTAWNPHAIADSALPPCHVMFICNIAAGRLHLHMIMRSTDVFLGLPFNIASYALLLHMLACTTGYLPGELVVSLTDAHLYANHVKQAYNQLKRVPDGLPMLELSGYRESIFDFKYSDFALIGYSPQPAIKADVAI